MRKMQIWKFQKIFYFSDPLSLKEEKCRFDVTEDFKLFNFLNLQSEKNADLDATIDFKVFNFSDPCHL